MRNKDKLKSKFKTMDCDSREIDLCEVENDYKSPTKFAKTEIPNPFLCTAKEVKDIVKKFKPLGTGQIVIKKGVFKKNLGKGFNACVRYSRALSIGVNKFKIQILSECRDRDNQIVLAFEKPYNKGNFICKTRMQQNAIGITADGRVFGHKNMVSNEGAFVLKHGDEVECVADFNNMMIKMSVNDKVIMECFNNSPQLYFIIYMHSVGEAFKLLNASV